MSPFVTVPLLVLHAIAALLLIGALTHQALALWWPAAGPRAGWWRALGGVHPERYVGLVVSLSCLTVLVGAVAYVPFRVAVRAEYLDANMPWATGLFEIKEHAAAIGLALLPAYAAVWRGAADRIARRALTTLLTVLAWWNFLVGHVVNNVRGL